MQYSQVIMCEDDFISKKDILGSKKNITNLKINEELNIYYVAATRAMDALNLANLDLNYSFDESKINNQENFKVKNSKKKVPMKKLKELQNRWLESNKIKHF